MNQSCIYEIVNSANGNRCVGSALNLRTRWNDHRHRLNKQIHYNAPLQRAWNKYGESLFWFSVIELCHSNELVAREQHAIDALKPQYNVLAVARSPLGRKHTEESKRKMSIAKSGTRHSAETIAKMSASRIGRTYPSRKRRTMTAQHGKNISAALKGRVLSAEWIEKIAATKRGVALSEKHKAKLRLASIAYWIRRRLADRELLDV